MLGMSTVEALCKTVTGAANIGVSILTLGAHKAANTVLSGGQSRGVSDSSSPGISTVANTQALMDPGILQVERVLRLVTMIKGLLIEGKDGSPDWDQIKPSYGGVRFFCFVSKPC
jgi:hypothetical protein